MGTVAVIDALKRVLRPYVPMHVRRRILFARLAFRRPTAPLRRLPDFLVLGGQRCGTSSLYRWLGAHPCIVPSLRKETEYFSRYHDRGLTWYRSHFPTGLRFGLHSLRCPQPLCSFEATPDYLFHPHVPARARKVLPSAPLVVLLRNPVERAYSHYLHCRRLGFEELPFDEALDQEDDRVAEGERRVREDPDHFSAPWLLFSYRRRGLYADQLAGWLEHFPRERILVLRSEDLYAEPRLRYREILRFVGLESTEEPLELTPFSASFRTGRSVPAGSAIPDGPRKRLEAFYAEPNRRLEELLGRRMEW